MFGNQRPVAPWAAHNWWGQYDTPADLPNVAGAQLQISEVQAGDMAYALSTQLIYMCVTPTIGAAVWALLGGGGDATALATAVTGFSNANYYEGPASQLQGTTEMTHVVFGRLKTAKNGGTFESIVGCGQLFGGGGFELSKNGVRFTALITDALPANISSSGAEFGDASGGLIQADFSAGMFFYFAQTWDGSAGFSLVNGQNQFNVGTANVGYTPYAAGKYTWGMNAGGNNSPFEGAIVGSALHSAVFTEDQLFAHYLACRDANDLVDGGLSWDHRWLASEAVAGDPAPASLTDVGAAGTLYDLSLVGALSVETRRPYWIQSTP